MDNLFQVTLYLKLTMAYGEVLLGCAETAGQPRVPGREPGTNIHVGAGPLKCLLQSEVDHEMINSMPPLHAYTAFWKLPRVFEA